MSAADSPKFSALLTEYLELRDKDIHARGWLEEPLNESRCAELLQQIDALVHVASKGTV